MFILLADWSSKDPNSDAADDAAAMMAAHERYRAYLQSNEHRFPPRAYEFAVADWHHNFSDHRALHDSWVKSVRFVDASLPVAGDNRQKTFELLLLGAYHDGHLRLTYRNVQNFFLAYDLLRDGPVEIYRDEIRLSEAGLVLHEIEFLARDNWLIECEDIEVFWEPLVPGSAVEG